MQQRNGSISIDELATPAPPAVAARPSAAIIPFPMRHRQRWIAAQRQRAATFPHREREWLASQVDKYEDRLIEIGVVPALVESETDDLQRAFFGGDHDRTRVICRRSLTRA
jgi:hypothetical protein